ncbi:MAG: DUF3445 domain-containing protein, partial [Alphaproteobacteria bacterium]|nr:DUF3445 domain-containing protein [Alphaproteobacteria bacterium]
MQDFGSPLRLGLAPLAIEDWLAPRPGDEALLMRRREILDRHGPEVAIETSDARAAIDELHDQLVALGRMSGRERSVDAIGRQVCEDLCLLTAGTGGELRVTAGVVCFPNRWRLADKIGSTMLGTHAPVPDYAATVGASVDRFLERLRPMKAYARSNWGIVATTDLYTPDPTPALDPFGPDGAYVRREDQSFLKLPRTEAVVFSIRTSFAA